MCMMRTVGPMPGFTHWRATFNELLSRRATGKLINPTVVTAVLTARCQGKHWVRVFAFVSEMSRLNVSCFCFALYYRSPLFCVLIFVPFDWLRSASLCNIICCCFSTLTYTFWWGFFSSCLFVIVVSGRIVLFVFCRLVSRRARPRVSCGFYFFTNS